MYLVYVQFYEPLCACSTVFILLCSHWSEWRLIWIDQENIKLFEIIMKIGISSTKMYVHDTFVKDCLTQRCAWTNFSVYIFQLTYSLSTACNVLQLTVELRDWHVSLMSSDIQLQYYTHRVLFSMWKWVLDVGSNTNALKEMQVVYFKSASGTEIFKFQNKTLHVNSSYAVSQSS